MAGKELKEKKTDEQAEKAPFRTIRSMLETAVEDKKPIALLVKGSVICGVPGMIEGECVLIVRGSMLADSMLGFTRGSVWVDISRIDGIGGI